VKESETAETDVDDRQLLARAMGARIRARRHELGLTLQELAAETDLSHPFLSQVERGLARPSFGSLQGIATALNISPSALLGSASTPPVQVFRATDAVEHPQPYGIDGAVRVLAPSDAGVQLVESVGGPDEYLGPDTTTTGQALIYVLNGTVEVRADGDAHQLGAGDAILIDVGVAHNIRVTGPTDSGFLYLTLSSPGG
jgi:transcriptional regulator with XRE-family HTH domain